jgi:hypothetical protein
MRKNCARQSIVDAQNLRMPRPFDSEAAARTFGVLRR